MIVRPGTNSPSTLDMVEMIRTNSTKLVDITFMDDSEEPTSIDESISPSGDPSGELELEVTDISGLVLYSETYWPPPIPDTRRITNPSTGKYTIKWGSDTESSSPQPILFNWHLRQNSTSEDFYRTQVAEIVSPKTLSLLPTFRLLIDKSIKLAIPDSYCAIGYTDAQLVIYLQAGLSRINASQPYVGWQNLDAFPTGMYYEILCRAALSYALMSQTLFAIDTDIPSYSDNGIAFQITHATQLKGVMDSLNATLDRDIKEFKLHFVSSGSIISQLTLGLGFYQMLASSPPGSLFRNTYTNL